MNFTIPTVDDLVEKFSAIEAEVTDPQVAIDELVKSNTKEDLAKMIVEARATRRTDTVQELAKAMLQDPDMIAASYEDIASAIRIIKPEAKTSSKSIASYVSKKREEWNLPDRIRVNKPRAKKEATEEAPAAEEEAPAEEV